MSPKSINTREWKRVEERYAVNGVNRITDDEVTLLSTGIATLFRDSPKRGTTAMITCADGKIRQLNQLQAVELIDKVCQLAGHEAGVNRKAGLAAAGKF